MRALSVSDCILTSDVGFRSLNKTGSVQCLVKVKERSRTQNVAPSIGAISCLDRPRIAASALAASAEVQTAQAQQRAQAQPAPAERQAEHSRHHGRRCRLVQYRRLSPGHHVRQDAEPRQARRRRHALHRLLCRSKLHRRSRQFHHRRIPLRTGLTTVGQAGADVGMPDAGAARSRLLSRRRATPPASSARTISAI